MAQGCRQVSISEVVSCVYLPGSKYSMLFLLSSVFLLDLLQCLIEVFHEFKSPVTTLYHSIFFHSVDECMVTTISLLETGN